MGMRDDLFLINAANGKDISKGGFFFSDCDTPYKKDNGGLSYVYNAYEQIYYSDEVELFRKIEKLDIQGKTAHCVLNVYESSALYLPHIFYYRCLSLFKAHVSKVFFICTMDEHRGYPCLSAEIDKKSPAQGLHKFIYDRTIFLLERCPAGEEIAVLKKAITEFEFCAEIKEKESIL